MAPLVGVAVTLQTDAGAVGGAVVVDDVVVGVVVDVVVVVGAEADGDECFDPRCAIATTVTRVIATSAAAATHGHRLFLIACSSTYRPPASTEHAVRRLPTGCGAFPRLYQPHPVALP